MRLLLLVLMVLAWAFDGLKPADPGDSIVALATIDSIDVADAEEGHGAYCRGAVSSLVFLGRDAAPGVLYSEFRSWCEARGGQTGWAA